MERLTERNKHGGIVVPMDGVQKDVMFMRLAHALAAYEDAEEQGRLIEVSSIKNEGYLISNGEIIHVHQELISAKTPENKYSKLLLKEWNTWWRTGTLTYNPRFITVYATREEAEAALAAMKGEQP